MSALVAAFRLSRYRRPTLLFAVTRCDVDGRKLPITNGRLQRTMMQLLESGKNALSSRRGEMPSPRPIIECTLCSEVVRSAITQCTDSLVLPITRSWLQAGS